MLQFFLAAPGGVPTQTAFSQSRRWGELDLDRTHGVIRSAKTPFSHDGACRAVRQPCPSCALITGGRFSGGTSGLSIGHVSPEAASGGMIGLVRVGDRIEIDIPARGISLMVPQAELSARRVAQDGLGWKPAAPRARKVSTALRAYALFATSAARGAVRGLPGD